MKSSIFGSAMLVLVAAGAMAQASRPASAPASQPTVAELLQVIRTGDAEKQLRALGELADMNQGAAPALPELSVLLRHRDQKMVVHAAYAIGKINPAALRDAPDAIAA